MLRVSEYRHAFCFHQRFTLPPTLVPPLEILRNQSDLNEMRRKIKAEFEICIYIYTGRSILRSNVDTISRRRVLFRLAFLRAPKKLVKHSISHRTDPTTTSDRVKLPY